MGSASVAKAIQTNRILFYRTRVFEILKEFRILTRKILTIMQRSLFFGFIAAILLVLFATQNIEPVELHLFWGEPIKGSLSIIIIVSVFIGVLLGFIFSYPSIAKAKKTNRQQQKEIERLKNVVETFKQETTHEKNEETEEKDEF